MAAALVVFALPACGDPRRDGAELAAQLRTRSDLLGEYFGESIDYLREGLDLAASGPQLLDGC